MSVNDERAGKPRARIGGWSILGDRVAVEAICRLGVDFIGIDSQHGFFSFDVGSRAVQVANLCGIPTLVRVPASQTDWIPRYLDAGADGIVVAMVNSAPQAAEAIALSRYQPHGTRSYGGGKRNGVGEPPTSSARHADLTPQVFIMVETPSALEHLKEIAATPGLAGIYVGPSDLGMALNRPYPLPMDDGPWHAAVDRVLEACSAAKIRAGMFAVDGDDARQWAGAGFDDIVLSSDIALLRRSMREHLVRARAPITSYDTVSAARHQDPYSSR